MRNVNTTIEVDGDTYQAQLATITSTGLGDVADRGIFTASITCQWQGGGISPTGGYCLDTPVKDEDGKFLRRAGTAAGMDYISRILAVAGVDRWEKLVDRRIWVLFPEGNGGWGSEAVGIASVDSDESLVFKAFWSAAKVASDVQ